MPVTTRVLILKIAAFALLIGPGFLMILAPVTPSQGLVEAFLDLAHQPLDGGQRITEDSAFLLNAILGGILIGFGAMIWMITERVYKLDPVQGRPLILIPLVCWFVTDSLGSVLAGAPFNAVINVLIIVTFLVPLMMPAKE